jgi:hypothetical protein
MTRHRKSKPRSGKTDALVRELTQAMLQNMQRAYKEPEDAQQWDADRTKRLEQALARLQEEDGTDAR